MTEPHPLRCETCNHHENDEELTACEIRQEWMPEEVWNWLQVVGCASHSSAAGEAVLDERKRILDEIRVWLHQHCYWFYVNGHEGEQRYHFEVVKFREFLEELREQQGER